MKNKINKYWESEYYHYIAMGYTFGYPKCCIMAFIEDRIILYENGQLDKIRPIILNDNCSGFLPCEKHEKQVKSGKITLSSLIQPYRMKDLPKFKEQWDK